MDGTAAIRVLLIASGTAPDWQRAGVTYETVIEPELATAADRLSAGPLSDRIDAVVLDAHLSDQPETSLRYLLEGHPGIAGIILADEAVMCTHEPAWCSWMPAGAPAALQAELLCLAVERTRLRQAVGRSEARFRDVIERNADALVVMDRHGMILFANRMAVQLFGQPRHELIGSPFGFPVVAGETTELDVHANGHARVVEMRVVESEWEGSVACIASLRDITHRKQAEENARGLIREQAARSVAEAAARRFRFLADSSTVLSSSLDYHTTLTELAALCVTELADWAVVYIVDDVDRVRRLEVAHRDPSKYELACALRDSPVALMDPHPVLDVLRTRSSVLVRQVGAERLMSLSDDPQHVELIRALGVTSFMVVPLTARDRSLGAIALISAAEHHTFDAADLELAEDLALRAALAVDNARLYHTAQEVNQAKSDLFAAISHDLRTPLNSIIGHADLLSMGIPDPLSEGSLRHVERIGTSATHLVHLIDELLTLVRLDAGREELHLSDIRVADLVQDVSAVVELLAVERGLAFSTEIADPGLTLRTDPSRLRQVLLNLVGNAIKYTEKGTVRLDVLPERDVIALRVVDSGVGLAAGDLEHMFEPFWQANSARRTIDKGTGLGLSVVQRLVSLLGGRIQVESELGRGSTFTVTLPVSHPLDHDGGSMAQAAFSRSASSQETNELRPSPAYKQGGSGG